MGVSALVNSEGSLFQRTVALKSCGRESGYGYRRNEQRLTCLDYKEVSWCPVQVVRVNVENSH